MSETNPNNPPPSGYGIPLFQWLVENVLFIKRRINAIAQNMSGGGGAHINGTGFVIASGTTLSYLTGTSSQFVKADGTLDSTAYLPLTGGTLTSGANITFSTVTGTKLGTSASEKLGFFNATPVVQQTGNIISALQTLGLVTSGSISVSDMSTLLSTANTWAAAQRGAFNVLTYSATTTIDLSLANNYRIQLTGNVTFGVPTNIVEGQSGVINCWQDGTGSRTVAWAWLFTFPGGTAPTPSSGKYQMDQFVYMVNRYSTSSVTFTNATPTVVTWTAHGLISGAEIQFTGGSLPTGVSASTSYWVNVTGTDTFNISSSFANLQAGTYVATSSTGSGTGTVGNIVITCNNAII